MNIVEKNYHHEAKIALKIISADRSPLKVLDLLGLVGALWRGVERDLMLEMSMELELLDVKEVQTALTIVQHDVWMQFPECCDIHLWEKLMVADEVALALAVAKQLFPNEEFHLASEEVRKIELSLICGPAPYVNLWRAANAITLSMDHRQTISSQTMRPFVAITEAGKAAKVEGIPITVFLPAFK